MPNISLPPAPTALAVAAAAPAATSGANPGEPFAGAKAPPFAALLMKQMAAGLKLQSGATALSVTASAPAGLEMPEGAILSPELLALIDRAALAVATADDPELATDPAAAALLAIAAPIAAPVVGKPLSPAPMDGADVVRNDTAGGQNRPAATAILAANTSLDGKKLAADADAGKAFELMAAGAAREEPAAAPRSDSVATPAATQHLMPTRVEAPIGTRQWDGEVANKVVWMATRNEQRADLVLTPPSLGRVEVSVSVNGDHATAVFTSINPAVREALEGAMPRLREAMLEAGINLGQTQVGSESPQQSAEQHKSGDNPANAMAAAGREAAAVGAPPADPFRGVRGLVDIFA